MSKVIEINNLSLYYNDVCALDNINLTVHEKDYLGVIGPNGGGKSTLIKVILGLLKPSCGSVKLFGKPPLNCGIPVGYVPQFSSFDRSFPINVETTVLTGRLYNRNPFFLKFTKKDREFVKELLQKLGIHDLSKRQIGSLSGGQLQRVLIARALATNPRVLFLDEPTANVDASAQNEILSLLKKLNESITIVMVTHDIGAISANVKNIACLNTRLYYHGTPKLSNSTIENLYGCNIDIITHGIPHKVLEHHSELEQFKEEA